MDIREEVAKFLSAPENFELAVEVSERIEEARHHIRKTFWEAAEKELISRLAGHAAEKYWTVSRHLSPSENYADLRIDALHTKESAGLGFALQQENTDLRLYKGLCWTRAQRNEPPTQPVLREFFADFDRAQVWDSQWDWWPAYVDLDIQLGEDSKLLSIVQGGASKIAEDTALQLWELFQSYEQPMWDINEYMAKHPNEFLQDLDE